MEYKVEISDEEKALMDQGSGLYKQGALKKALPIFLQLSQAHPESPMLTATLANLYWDLGNIETAEGLFYKAVTIGPKSEKISRGLLHILWEQNKEPDAVNEIQRFLNEGEASESYIDIAKEINLKRKFSIIIPPSNS